MLLLVAGFVVVGASSVHGVVSGSILVVSGAVLVVSATAQLTFLSQTSFLRIPLSL